MNEKTMQLQMFAITNKVKNGKTKNPEKAKQKVIEIRQRIAWNKFLSK
jgi:hypothetical protein